MSTPAFEIGDLVSIHDPQSLAVTEGDYVVISATDTEWGGWYYVVRSSREIFDRIVAERCLRPASPSHDPQGDGGAPETRGRPS